MINKYETSSPQSVIKEENESTLTKAILLWRVRKQEQRHAISRALIFRQASSNGEKRVATSRRVGVVFDNTPFCIERACSRFIGDLSVRKFTFRLSGPRNLEHTPRRFLNQVKLPPTFVSLVLPSFRNSHRREREIEREKFANFYCPRQFSLHLRINFAEAEGQEEDHRLYLPLSLVCIVNFNLLVEAQLHSFQIKQLLAF